MSPATTLIEIGYKETAADPVGRGLIGDVHHLGVGKAKNIRVSQLYQLIGSVSSEDRHRIVESLLCDPIVQTPLEPAGPSKVARLSKRSAPAGPLVIDVWYKHGVTDVIGESVAKGIHDLGVKSVSDVRTGARYKIWGIPKAKAQKLTLALLANPLVHDYVIDND